MIVNFIEVQEIPYTGLIIKSADLCAIPDVEDRIRIGSNLYTVRDRTFQIGNENKVDIYIYNISKTKYVF